MKDLNYMHNVLLIEDNPHDVELIKFYLKNFRTPVNLEISRSIKNAIFLIKNHDFNIILTDLNLPDSDGMFSVQRLMQASPSAPVIVLTGSDDEDWALEAVKKGAQDYLIKSKINGTALARVMDYATERYKQAEKWKYLAFHDELTGIGNRTMMLHDLEANIEQVKRYGGQFALHILDLNDFKVINDTYGHDAGDVLLKMVANRLMASIRKVDSVVRFGGDEFVMLQYGVNSLKDVEIMKCKIKKAFNEPFIYEGNNLLCYASMGSAIYPHHATSIDTLIKKADGNLYEDKEANRSGKHTNTKNDKEDLLESESV